MPIKIVEKLGIDGRIHRNFITHQGKSRNDPSVTDKEAEQYRNRINRDDDM